MSKTCILVLTRAQQILESNDDYIGVDQGSLLLARLKKRMKLAIGDFDSIHPNDLSLIHEYADEVICLNPIKDDSDSEAAIVECVSRGYDHMILCGALGGRIDHEFVNLRLAKKYAEKVVLINDQNKIYWINEGTHTIKKTDFQYVSFFCDYDSIITLKGMKYPLDHQKIKIDDLYTLSNEIVGEEAQIIVHEGSVMVIQSKDK